MLRTDSLHVLHRFRKLPERHCLNAAGNLCAHVTAPIVSQANVTVILSYLLILPHLYINTFIILVIASTLAWPLAGVAIVTNHHHPCYWWSTSLFSSSSVQRSLFCPPFFFMFPSCAHHQRQPESCAKRLHINRYEHSASGLSVRKMINLPSLNVQRRCR